MILLTQLGPPAAPRPGAPDVRGERPGPSHGPQHHREPAHQGPRRRGPSAQARDSARRAAWLQKKQEAQQEVPAENMVVLATSNMDTVLTETLESHEAVITSPTQTLESSEAEIQTSNNISCDLCEHVSQTKGGLKIHIGRKHKEIPQLDGEGRLERDTDCWWEKNSIFSMESLQVYKDVLEDIKESKLSKEEKLIEEDRALDARMWRSRSVRA